MLAVLAAVAGVAALAAAGAAAQEPTRLDERAHQDREIVYFLRDPDTHAFDLFHDYTETREGTSRYVNVVRKGSTVAIERASSPPDEALKRDPEGRGIMPPRRQRRDGAADSEVVWCGSRRRRGASVRPRISATYTDPLDTASRRDWSGTAASPARATRWCSPPAGANRELDPARHETEDGTHPPRFVKPSPTRSWSIKARRRGGAR